MTNIEQLSIVVRFIHKTSDTASLEERFIGFKSLKKQDAQSYASGIE